MSNLKPTTEEIIKRFRAKNVPLEKLKEYGYIFLDQNKFFEVYNSDVYLHFIGLTGCIEFSIKNNQIIEFLGSYLKERERIFNE